MTNPIRIIKELDLTTEYISTKIRYRGPSHKYYKGYIQKTLPTILTFGGEEVNQWTQWFAPENYTIMRAWPYGLYFWDISSPRGYDVELLEYDEIINRRGSKGKKYEIEVWAIEYWEGEGFKTDEGDNGAPYNHINNYLVTFTNRSYLFETSGLIIQMDLYEAKKVFDKLGEPKFWEDKRND
jgi:hypothetical protein